MTEAKNLYQNRRSVYALGKNLPIFYQVRFFWIVSIF